MSSKAAKKATKVVVEDTDVDVELEVEEPTTKVPTKPKVASKVSAGKDKAKKGGKQPANPEKSADTAAKKKAEQDRYDAALATAAELGLVTVFEELTPASVQDKWATAVGLHILETINHIQQVEVRKEGDYNPYPSKEFVLFEDKVSSSGKKKSQVKTGKADTKTSASKKKAPLKRGAKHAVEEPEDHEEAVEQEDQHDSVEESAEPTEKTPEEKEEKKKNITTFTRDAKSYLGFFVMRFVDDYYSSEGGKNVKNDSDFTSYTYTAITKDIYSQVSRAVVTSVNRMQYLVSDLPARGVPDELTKLVGTHFSDRGSLIKFMGEYLSDYLKLIGVILANQIWVSRKMINQQAVDMAIRFINLGNYDAMLEAKAVSESESDCGLACGFFQDSHVYNNLVIAKAPKKPRTKAAKTDKGKKPKKKEAEEEDPEADPEPEEDPDAEHEAEAEEDAEEEVELEIDPEEEEEEVVPVTAKNLKKLRN